ncbi:MAG: methyltransferase [Selenomonadaceae bacterium]|nr:methyltransferase [Selenomonadaceae bacterium]
MNRILFLKKFIDEPKKIGSLTPSSKFLARKMLQNLPWKNFSHIAELGAGTGIFTEQIIERKSPACKCLIVEQDFSMQHLLKEKYNNPPRSNLIFDSFAEDLYETLQEINFPPLDCVISGLPFANMEKDLQRRIIENVHCSLKRDGIFVMFQYSLQMKKLLNEYFSSVETSFFLLNFPPAFVYLCKK